MNCLNCKKETSNPKYCSHSCSAKVNNRRDKSPKRSKILRTCKECSSQYRTSSGHRSRILCSRCVLSYKRLRTKYSKQTTLREVRNSLAVKGKHPSWIHSRVRVNNKSWNKGLAKLPCQKCFYSFHVELCHIRDIADFPDSTTLGEVNDPTNILVLCRNCHWEFDNGHLSIKNISSR